MHTVKCCIPEEWKRVVQYRDNGVSEFVINDILKYPFQIPDKGIKNLQSLTSKELYDILLFSKTIQPRCKNYWINMYPSITSSWCNVFEMNTCNRFIPRAIIDFNWKLIHGVVNTEDKLQKMKYSDGKCTICTENETVRHLLIECKDVKNIWNMINLILRKAIDDTIQLNDQHILIGMVEERTEDMYITNMVIAIVRWIIWKRRNKCKFEQSLLTFNQFKCFVLSNIQIHIDTLMKSRSVKICSKDKLNTLMDVIKHVT